MLNPLLQILQIIFSILALITILDIPGISLASWHGGLFSGGGLMGQAFSRQNSLSFHPSLTLIFTNGGFTLFWLAKNLTSL